MSHPIHPSHLPQRRRVLLSMAAMGLVGPPAWAQGSYPAKPVRIVVPYPAGGPVDAIARGLAQRLGQAWGQQVLIENKPGASEIIATDYVSKSPPDGLTLLFSANASLAWNMYLHSKLPYDAVRDMAPVTRVSDANMVLAVRGDLPVNSVKEFVALAKSQPGKLSYGSTGIGTGPHIWMEDFKRAEGFDLLHVPFPGVAPAIQNLVGGQIDAAIVGSTAALPHLASGRVKVLAVSGARRIKALPQVPTFAEAGYPKVDFGFYLGLSAPAATPKPIIDKIAADFGVVLRDKAFTDKLMGDFGFEPAGDTPVEFAQFLQKERATMAARIQATGIKVD